MKTGIFWMNSKSNNSGRHRRLTFRAHLTLTTRSRKCLTPRCNKASRLMWALMRAWLVAHWIRARHTSINKQCSSRSFQIMLKMRAPKITLATAVFQKHWARRPWRRSSRRPKYLERTSRRTWLSSKTSADSSSKATSPNWVRRNKKWK